MKKQIVFAAVISALALSPLAVANSVQGSTSTPTTQWDSQGDMASGYGAYAAGTTQANGTEVQCQSGPAGTSQCGFVFLPKGEAAGYGSSYASGIFAYAGPGKGQTIYGQDTALGNSATALGFAATAIGSQAHALGTGSTAVGTDSTATGLNATALGAGADAAGAGSVAAGVGSVASGWESVAVGSQAHAKGAFADASGANASASGAESTALGANSVAKGSNSVALGQGSVANRANSVSVGDPATGMTRQVTNVSAGTAGTDAVNVNQLNGTAATLHQQIQSSAQQLQSQFGSEIAGVHSYATQEADSVGAMSAATADAAFSAAGLRTHNRAALGVGEMGGQVAESVAYQHAFGKHWTANATVASGQAGVQVGVGAGFGW
jgi:autotransporter adhesin